MAKKKSKPTNLPKYGITAVIEGLPAFRKAMDTIDRKIEAVEKAEAKKKAEDKEEKGGK